MSVRIRKATSRDMAAVGQLAAQLVGAHHGFDAKRFLAPTDRTASGYARFLASELDDADTLVLVADDGGHIVGYAYASLEDTDWMSLRGPAGVLHDLFVVETYRGKAIGGRLLEDAVSALTARGAPQIVLSTAAANAGAQRFFARAGFRSTMIEMTRQTEP